MTSLYKKITIYFNNPAYKKIIIAFALIIPAIPVIYSLSQGYIPFWYDPARDLLEAQSNLHKLSLIGPTSGIQGIFYGPYWIWLLSLGLLISKDPVLVTFITATLPYFILFPLIWFRFTKFFGLKAVLICWLLFMFSTGMTYATALWNPYPAALLTLCVIYLLIIAEYKIITKKYLLLFLIQGFLIGLILNFHISFGIGFVFGIILFKLIELVYITFRDKKKRKKLLTHFSIATSFVMIGILISYIPTLIFESRHGFHQIQTLLNTFFQYGGVVDVKGLSKMAIGEKFFTTFAKLVSLPQSSGFFIFAALCLIGGFLLFKKKITLTFVEKKILVLVGTLIAAIVIIYLTAKNPVWNYHFICVDILLLVFLGLYISKVKYISFITFLLVLYAGFNSYQILFDGPQNTFLDDYDVKKKVVKTIAQDAQNIDYSVFAYNRAIYTYDYSYLFQWIAGKNVPYDPGNNKPTKYIYLIFPSKENAFIQDFIHFRGHENTYKTVKIWEIDQEMKIIKVEAK